ncbi:hypothetical protein CCH79_00020165 [Gambusia affinis]|uniref:Uncharacterized protein n=1 Tax=Gambusia affinis TaxID=33528 RepID=A0A315VS02_GAMAF|nr:hypothetical protein CCH79_00020165 [Gambusia affinis]
MSLQARRGSQKRPFCSLLAGHGLKKPKPDDGERLQEAAVQLLEQNQNLYSLFQELQNPDPCGMICFQNMEQNRNPEQNQAASDADPLNVAGLLEERDEAAERWIQTLDASLCGGSVSPEALQRFFAHCLTQIFTWNPQLTVSDAVTSQNDWTVAKAGRCLTSLCCKLAVIFSVEQLLHHLQQVLETHEVNWKHVLVFVSTLLVYDQSAQSSLSELLCRLLSSAFGGYDLEKLITAFLLARQGALEGAGVFPSYTDWFKMSFGGRSGFHAGSKKSLVFLLKFLSDLVPFEPPQYLKVHILHPPFVPPKLRSLLMEYVTLAKTRLADLQESVEDMGLYEDVSAAGASLQSQAAQDVEKAVCLFESSGRIPATVMEASIFRRPYFLTRFLPVLLKPRAFPLKADAQMNFIEALKQAEKIPAAQYSQYVESCQKQRQQSGSPRRSGAPLAVLQEQLQEFTKLLAAGRDPGSGSVPLTRFWFRSFNPVLSLAQLSRISHTLSVVCPGSDDPVGPAAASSLPELHLKVNPVLVLEHVGSAVLKRLCCDLQVVDLILQSFCQSLLVASRGNPPNRQNLWGSRFVCMLLDNRQLLSSVIHRLKDLFHQQAASLKPAHILGLAAFISHLQAAQPGPALVEEALGSAVLTGSRTSMLFSVRLAVAAVSYGLCRGHSASPQRLQDFVPRSLYKKLLYLVPRLFPEARIRPEGQGGDGPTGGHLGDGPALLWSFTDGTSWIKTVLHLWRHASFQQLQQLQLYQLCFSEWLHEELRVQRNSDVLSDAERQEYQQWACWELYLPRPEEQGGCGGDPRALCSHLLTAVMEPPSREMNLENLDFSPGLSGTGTCLPDLLSRLQELVYEAEVGELRGRRGGLGDFLLQVVSEKCSPSSGSISSRLSLERTMEAWNRCCSAQVTPVDSVGGSRFLRFWFHSGPASRMENLFQSSCSFSQPADSGPAGRTRPRTRFPPTRKDHRYTRTMQERGAHGPQFEKDWSKRTWLSVVLFLRADPVLVQIPPGPVLVQAASLHGAFRSGAEHQQNFREVLDRLREVENQQVRVQPGSDRVLVSLLFLFVMDFLSELLDPQVGPVQQNRRCALLNHSDVAFSTQEKSSERSKWFCSELLAVLVNSADWLLLFRSNGTVYPTLAAPDLWFWMFCSLKICAVDVLQNRTWNRTRSP